VLVEVLVQDERNGRDEDDLGFEVEVVETSEEERRNLKHEKEEAMEKLRQCVGAVERSAVNP
jgi:hypothetical protein